MARFIICFYCNAVLLPFANANVIHHFSEDRPSIEENTKRAYGKVYTFNTSAIASF